MASGILWYFANSLVCAWLYSHSHKKEPEPLGTIQLSNYVINYAPTKIRPYAFLLTGVSPQYPSYHICAMSPESCLKWFDEIAKETRLLSPRDVRATLPDNFTRTTKSTQFEGGYDRAGQKRATLPELFTFTRKSGPKSPNSEDARPRTKSKAMVAIESDIKKRVSSTVFIDNILDQLTLEASNTLIELFNDDENADSLQLTKTIKSSEEAQRRPMNVRPPLSRSTTTVKLEGQQPSQPPRPLAGLTRSVSSFLPPPRPTLPTTAIAIPASAAKTPNVPSEASPTTATKERNSASGLRQRSKARTFSVEQQPKEYSQETYAHDDMTLDKEKQNPTEISLLEPEKEIVNGQEVCKKDNIQSLLEANKDEGEPKVALRGSSGRRRAPGILSYSAPPEKKEIQVGGMQQQPRQQYAQPMQRPQRPQLPQQQQPLQQQQQPLQQQQQQPSDTSSKGGMHLFGNRD